MFRMVPKHKLSKANELSCFRAVLFRMVPKQSWQHRRAPASFRAVLFRMVPKPRRMPILIIKEF